MIYFDHAATTRVLPEAAQAAMKTMTEDYGNPSSLYQLGVQAAKRMGEHREQVARALGCQGEEVYFTSGGTEGDNWAVALAVHLAATRAGTSSPRRSSTPRCFSPARSWSARDMRSPTSTPTPPAGFGWRTWRPPCPVKSPRR